MLFNNEKILKICDLELCYILSHHFHLRGCNATPKPTQLIALETLSLERAWALQQKRIEQGIDFLLFELMQNINCQYQVHKGKFFFLIKIEF